MAESSPKIGYYTRDTGRNVYHYYMGAEPPGEQYILRGQTWEPLVDGWSLMDMVIDGTPDLAGPVPDPPEGVPAVRKGRNP